MKKAPKRPATTKSTSGKMTTVATKKSAPSGRSAALAKPVGRTPSTVPTPSASASVRVAGTNSAPQTRSPSNGPGRVISSAPASASVRIVATDPEPARIRHPARTNTPVGTPTGTADALQVPFWARPQNAAAGASWGRTQVSARASWPPAPPQQQSRFQPVNPRPNAIVPPLSPRGNYGRPAAPPPWPPNATMRPVPARAVRLAPAQPAPRPPATPRRAAASPLGLRSLARLVAPRCSRRPRLS